MELCKMIVHRCAQQRTYQHFYGLLGQRLCSSKVQYIIYFEQAFIDQYKIIDHLENVKLRNIAKSFGHLLTTNSI